MKKTQSVKTQAVFFLCFIILNVFLMFNLAEHRNKIKRIRNNVEQNQDEMGIIEVVKVYDKIIEEKILYLFTTVITLFVNCIFFYNIILKNCGGGIFFFLYVLIYCFYNFESCIRI